MNPQAPIDLNIRALSWQEGATLLLSVRHAVFVIEQQVPAEIEVDDDDPICQHFLASDAHNFPLGTARLSPSGKVGRVAVLQAYRRHGIGRALMLHVIQHARSQSLPTLKLHGQVSSIPFYQSLGFVAEGPVFEEADIPHRLMRLAL